MYLLLDILNRRKSVSPDKQQVVDKAEHRLRMCKDGRGLGS